MKNEKRDAMLKGRPYRPDTKKEAGESGGEKKHSAGVVPFRHRPITKQLAVRSGILCLALFNKLKTLRKNISQLKICTFRNYRESSF